MPLWTILPNSVLPFIIRLVFVETWSAPGDNLAAEWANWQIVPGSTDRLQTLPAPAGRAGNALRVEVRNGDVAHNSKGQGTAVPSGWRAEAIPPFDEVEGKTALYTWSTYFHTAYPRNATVSDPQDSEFGQPVWQVFTQWHQRDERGDVGVSPPIEFIVVNGQLLFTINSPDPANPVLREVVADDMAPGTWHEFQLLVLWSSTAGAVRLWRNGTLRVSADNVPTLFFRPGPAGGQIPGENYLKMGLYRKAKPANGTFELWHDDVRRGYCRFEGFSLGSLLQYIGRS